MAVTNTFKLSLFFTLVSLSLSAVPRACRRIECPNYDLVQARNGYEIRRYNSTVWISSDPIQDISLVEATRTGFLRLFDYIQGKNNYHQKIEMTAPVHSEVFPSDGPFCKSSFVVSFYVPKKNQANPPPAEGLQVQRYKLVYAAVRQFGGFVKDTNVGEQAAELKESIAGTKLEGITPEEFYSDVKPSLTHLKVFGYIAHRHVSDQLRIKLDDKSSQMILVGYHSTGGYKLFNLVNK